MKESTAAAPKLPQAEHVRRAALLNERISELAAARKELALDQMARLAELGQR